MPKTSWALGCGSSWPKIWAWPLEASQYARPKAPLTMSYSLSTSLDSQKSLATQSLAMIGENWQLVTNELVEVQDYMKITDHFRGNCIIYPNLIKEIRRM